MVGFSHQGFLHGKLSGRALTAGVCFTASSGFFLLGYDQGVMSGILTEPNFLKQFPGMSPDNAYGAVQALVVAIYEIGCLMGALFIVGYGDKVGRRRSVLLGASIMLVGAAIQTSSYSLAQLIVGRIVTGAGNGMNTSTIPVWQSEMAPAKIRGFLVLFEGALITAGIVLSYWLNYGFWFLGNYPDFQWRFPIAFQCVFGIILIIGVLAFPESPRWLLKHGKEEEAVAIMAQMYETTTDDREIVDDVKEINKLNKETQGRKLSWREFLSNGKEMNLWRFMVACGSQAFQQLSGINLVTYYATTVFEKSLGFDAQLSRFMTAWLGTEYFIAACAALFIVDRVGRRNLMMYGAGGMALSLLAIAVSLSQATEEYRKPAIVATVFIFVYDTAFAIGWLGVGWLYPAEITPIRTRAEINGFSTVTNWLGNYVVVQLSPIMINTIAWKTYFVFFCTNIAFIPLVYFLFPEPNGWKLETLDAIFAEAHEKKENPVFTEKRWRKNGWQKKQSIDDGRPDDGTLMGSDSEEKNDLRHGATSHQEEKAQ